MRIARAEAEEDFVTFQIFEEERMRFSNAQIIQEDQ